MCCLGNTYNILIFKRIAYCFFALFENSSLYSFCKRLNKDGIVEIVRYGGKLGGKYVYAVDSPTFFEGEKIILFLEEHLSEEFGRNYAINGMSQGKFTIEDDKVFRNSTVPLMTNKNGQALSVQKGNSVAKDVFINSVKNISKFR